MKQIRIDPPPSDGKCDRCGKLPKKKFPSGAILTKTFRCLYRGTDNEQVGASWECVNCIGKEN